MERQFDIYLKIYSIFNQLINSLIPFESSLIQLKSAVIKLESSPIQLEISLYENK